jgi:8-oxo-dGTP pyrophosphatase MutT (NUDIX family)
MEGFTASTSVRVAVAVHVLIWNLPGRLLLLQGDCGWEAPWGLLRPQETILQAAARIADQETGIQIGPGTGPSPLPCAAVTRARLHAGEGIIAFLVDAGTASGVPVIRDKAKYGALKWVGNLYQVTPSPGLEELAQAAPFYSEAQP